MTLVDVHFVWDDSKGVCYDCGRPAAYICPDLYGLNGTVDYKNLLCSVDASIYASEGYQIKYLFKEDG